MTDSEMLDWYEENWGELCKLLNGDWKVRGGVKHSIREAIAFAMQAQQEQQAVETAAAIKQYRVVNGDFQCLRG